MIFSFPLVKGRFLRRDNRFRCTVEIDEEEREAHVPNSGRLQELLHPGAIVYVQEISSSFRKTSCDLLLVDAGKTLVCVDARLPPELLAEAWEAGRVPPLALFSDLKREVRYEKSRFDMLFRNSAGQLCVVETKSVTLVRDGIAMFPDAPTSRGRRHVQTLVDLVEQGISTAIVFVAQRSDAQAFAPNDETDADFGGALRRAREKGVSVLAYQCVVSLKGICLQLPIPLVF